MESYQLAKLPQFAREATENVSCSVAIVFRLPGVGSYDLCLRPLQSSWQFLSWCLLG